MFLRKYNTPIIAVGAGEELLVQIRTSDTHQLTMDQIDDQGQILGGRSHSYVL